MLFYMLLVCLIDIFSRVPLLCLRTFKIESDPPSPLLPRACFHHIVRHYNTLYCDDDGCGCMYVNNCAIYFVGRQHLVYSFGGRP
jgi:hypothetical protein